MLRTQNQELTEGIRSLYSHFQSGQALPEWFPRGLGDDPPPLHEIVTSAKRLGRSGRTIGDHEDQIADPFMVMDQHGLPPGTSSSSVEIPYFTQSGTGSLGGALQCVQSDTPSFLDGLPNCIPAGTTTFDDDVLHCATVNNASLLQTWGGADSSSVSPFPQALTGASPSNPYVIRLVDERIISDLCSRVRQHDSAHHALTSNLFQGNQECMLTSSGAWTWEDSIAADMGIDDLDFSPTA